MEGSWPKRGPVYIINVFGPSVICITAMKVSSHAALFQARCKAILAVFVSGLWFTLSWGAYINIVMVEFFRTGSDPSVAVAFCARAFHFGLPHSC